MDFIKCYATDTDYNISSNHHSLSQAVCFDKHMNGLEKIIQGKILADWMDIINKKLEQLGLRPNLRTLPQIMTALITTKINLW